MDILHVIGIYLIDYLFCTDSKWIRVCISIIWWTNPHSLLKQFTDQLFFEEKHQIIWTCINNLVFPNLYPYDMLQKVNQHAKEHREKTRHYMPSIKQIHSPPWSLPFEVLDPQKRYTYYLHSPLLRTSSSILNWATGKRWNCTIQRTFKTSVQIFLKRGSKRIMLVLKADNLVCLIYRIQYHTSKTMIFLSFNPPKLVIVVFLQSIIWKEILGIQGTFTVQVRRRINILLEKIPIYLNKKIINKQQFLK